MLKNFLHVAVRNLLKNKSYVLINTFGLGVALACCITAYLLLAFNLEFDNYYDDRDVKDIFRVHTTFLPPDGEAGQFINAPISMGPAMVNDLAGIESFTRYIYDGGFVRFGDNAFNESIVFADSTFFELFEYPLLKGSFESFKKVNTVILDAETSAKFFGDDNPIGQVLTMNFVNQKEINVVVGAVIDRIPLNSSMVFNMMMRIENFMDIYNLSESDWGDWRDPSLLVKLKNPEDAYSYTQLLAQYIPLRNKMKPDMNVTSYHLEAFKEPTSYDDVMWSQLNIRINMMPLVIFTVMALMILLIACFNLTNTSFAITARRLKEVGVRKVIGASRPQIVFQFLLEMFLTILLSLGVGYLISRFIVTEFANMWNLQYGMADLNGVNLVVALLILIFLASLLAGLYPALTNSRYEPVALLKGNVKIKGTNMFTRTLVGAQFAISVIVLVNGLVFIQNTKYQEAIDYGFDMKNVLTIPIQDEQEYKILESRALSNPKITHTSITHHQLGLSSYPFPVSIDTTEYQVQHIEIGKNFFETMGLTLLEGRFINVENTTDEFQSIIVNEAFLEKTDLKDPLNTQVDVRGEKRRIVGIVKNHVDNVFRSEEPEPFVFYASKRNEYQMMLVKGDLGDREEIRSYLETVWKEEFPAKPFECNYQEDLTLGGLRQTNTNLKKIFIFLTILGGLLSMSGIFAIASLNIEKRTKEIGIRKALGATVSHMITLLSREFSVILLVAALIGSVGGYFLTSALLDEIYALHVAVGLIPVIISAISIILIGLLTTGSIIVRAAHANPVESLRDE